ncbi:MAG: hypothetical protein N0E48_20400 [Candidatus Thiodiazotropha endolucinida]|nr:hypothetical protein [Candidatus Thiodiazotropha taylori]MCW4345694.1 hypothetical protein [Candidatus Thiodiazotropha endolucinida]
MAEFVDSVSSPVGTEQNVINDGVFDMSTVGAMNTVTSEITHIPADKFVYIVANRSENELSLRPSQVVTSRPDKGLPSRLAEPLSSENVTRTANFTAPSVSSWRMNTQELEGATFRSTLEMEVAQTKQMLSQQQIALSTLTETLKSIQTDLGKKNVASSEIVDLANQAHTSTGSGTGVEVNKDNPIKRRISTFFSKDTDSESSCSDDDSEENDSGNEPPLKQSRSDKSCPEVSSEGNSAKLSKLDKLFSNKSEQGPKINENLAKSLNRGISNNFEIKSALEYGDIYKTPENCEYLRVPKLNEELFFEDSIASRFKKNDSILQKTQLLLTKGMTPLIQLMDKLIEQDDNGEIFDLATDSLQLLAYTHRDISNVRRKFLKPAVAKKYKRLCSANVPLTSHLLGDDLDKQLKSINEHKKIGAQMIHDNSRKRSYDRDYQQPSTSHRSDYGSRGNSQSFLSRQRGNNPRYKKGKGYSSQNNHNNNKKNK